MKAAVFVAEIKGGKVLALNVSETLDPVIKAARAARDTGKAVIDGKKRDIIGGMVLASWRPYPLTKFRVRQVAEAKAEVPPVEAKAGNAPGK